MANRNIERAVRIALLGAGAASIGAVSSAALAQETIAPTAQEVEQIIVTGSRIPQPNLEGASPVSLISSQDVTLTGTQQVANLMNYMPQMFAAQGGNLANGSTGTATLNLRGLGEVRTLVLINGRRMVAGDPGYNPPDVNQIPTPLIQRVEVLTGGASAVYGSDAVAGVVNFIMKDDFEGVEFNANISGYNHHNDDNFVRGLVADSGYKQAPRYIGWDGQTEQMSILMGSNFADGRGNATLFMGWQHTDGLLQSQRDYSSCAIGAYYSSTYCGGSSASYPGRFRPALVADNSNGHLVTDPVTGLPVFVANQYSMDSSGNQIPWSNASLYNYGPVNYWQRPDDRYSASAFLHYDVTDNARVYGEFMYMDDRSVSQIAPSGAFAYQNYNVPCDGSNPLITADWLTSLCGTQTTGTVAMQYARRNVEGGGRQQDLSHVSSRFVLGVKGDVFDDNWTYDVSGVYSRVDMANTYLHDFSKERLARAMNVVTDPDSGQPVCASVLDGSDTNCVPWDIWTVASQGGGPSQASLEYLQIPLLQSGWTELQTVSASLASDLGKYGITSPWANDGIGVSFGAEYVQQDLNLYTDAAYQANDGAGQGGPTLPVSGGYNNTDLFGEVRIPVVQDLPFAKELTFNGSYRYSEYSNPIDDNTSTYGLGLDWAPIDDIKLRGSYQHAVRAPNIVELFQTQGLNLWSAASFDPCASVTATLAGCLNTGLTAAQFTSGSRINDLTSSAGQYNFLQGGNQNLKPEESDSWTVGLVFTPTFLEGLSVTIDYWNIEVDDTITVVAPPLTAQQCYQTGSPVFCSNVHRDANGTLWASEQGYVVATNQNIGTTSTSGVDINGVYTFEIGDWGTLNTNLVGTYVDTFETQPLPDPGSVGKYDCVGYYGPTCGNPIPEWRSTLRETWVTPWNLDLSLAWRYYGSVEIDASSSNPLLAGYFPDFSKKMDAQNYIDFAGTYQFAEKYELNFGINNILDETPPIVDSGTAGPPYGNGNTFPQIYDALGRYLFAGITAKF